MNYKKLRNILYWAVMVIPLFLLTGNVSVYAQEEVSKRAHNRKIVPVDKLINRLEDPKRKRLLQPERVLDVFGVKSGECVADVGAGSGYFTFLLAARVGGKGKVYAVEIEDELLDYIRRKTDESKVTNIIPLKSSESDPKLPLASCDKILLVSTYYYLEDPVAFMNNIRMALKPGGLVAIIGVDPTKVKATKKMITASEVIDDMKRAGLVLHESFNFLANKYFLVFGANVIE